LSTTDKGEGEAPPTAGGGVGVAVDEALVTGRSNIKDCVRFCDVDESRCRLTAAAYAEEEEEEVVADG